MGGARVLVADDDVVICQVLEEIVSGLGHRTARATTAEATLRAVQEDAFDLILLDLRFPDCSDLSTLARIREASPDACVVMVSAESDDLGIVAEAVRLGAFDYVPKPIRTDDIRIRVTRALETRALRHMHARAVAELADGRQFDDIIGSSAPIRSVVEQARELALYDMLVLITGETGTGKELVARALHYGGPRRDKPFVSINCAALPRELTESELFGHEKGAFTGALTAKNGAFGEAADGTLFLDEVGDMDLVAQATLLHVLETGAYRSIGGRSRMGRARIVIATNRDLGSLIGANRFRRDLFYRINRVRVTVPPLREHIEDVPELARHFLVRTEAKVGKGVSAIDDKALEALTCYDWPGNVRELRNEIERAYIRTQSGCIRTVSLSGEIIAARLPAAEGEESDPASLEELSRLIEALRSSAGSVTKAASLLGVHRNTVHRWMRKHGLQKE